MDCRAKATVDFCSELECLKSTVMKVRKDLTVPHSLNHSMLKVHRLLFNRDTVGAERTAKETLGEPLSDLEARGEPMPRCSHCEESVSRPCWYVWIVLVSF